MYLDSGLRASFYSPETASIVLHLFPNSGLRSSFYTPDTASIICRLFHDTGLLHPFYSLDTGTDKTLLTATRLLRIIQDKFYFVLLSHLTLRLNVLFLIELRRYFG